MLSTVRGVGNDVGHTHGTTCKVKNLTPAKATLGTLHYIVWQHYDNFVFLRGFLWRFKKVFYTEPLLAFLRSSKMWMLRHWGSTHTHTHTRGLPSPRSEHPCEGCLVLPSLAEQEDGEWRWPAHSHTYCLWMWLKSSQDSQFWLSSTPSPKFSELPKST